MLDYAYYHQGELVESVRKALDNKDLYFYFMCPAKFFSIPLERDDWNSIQFVSLNPNGELLGLMAAYVEIVKKKLIIICLKLSPYVFSNFVM